MPDVAVSVEEMFMLIGQQALRIFLLEKERDGLQLLVRDLNAKLEAERKKNG